MTEQGTAQRGSGFPLRFFLRVLQGALIGVGAVLPGISGGVLCVVFGIYRPVMELLSNPLKLWKSHLRLLLPYIIGVGAGFLGIANVLAYVLNKYPDFSVSLFAGLIIGMMPSLFREAGARGRGRSSHAALYGSMAAVLALLLWLNGAEVSITPGTFWYVFCGVCLALSVIAPGMSFSTLLMPLGLYAPFVEGIGTLDFSVLIPAGIGALLTVVCFARAVNALFKRHYAPAFHGIAGIVVAATAMIIPYKSFVSGFQPFLGNSLCLAAGIAAALLLDRMNRSVPSEECGREF